MKEWYELWLLPWITITVVSIVIAIIMSFFDETPDITMHPTPSPIVYVEDVKEIDISYLQYVPEEYQEIVMKYSDQYKIPVKFLYRQIYIESKFNPMAFRRENNGTQSIGISQLNSAYMNYFIDKYYVGEDEFHPYNADACIQVQCAYVSDLFNRFGDWQSTFIAYNCGPGRVDDPPLMSVEYANAIVYGDFDAKIIKGALEGIK